MSENLTVGRGRLFVSRLDSNDNPLGYRFIGNAPGFSVSVESETLEHYSSTGGVKEVDLSVPLQTDRSGSITTDNISPENQALFYFGDAEALTVAAATGQTQTIENVILGSHYPINAVGVDAATDFAVTNAAGDVTYVVTDDYVFDARSGMIQIVATGGITAGEDIEVTYNVRAHTRSRVVTGNESFLVAIRFIEDNPVGDDKIVSMPKVRVTPGGEMEMIGDVFQEIAFNLNILKPTNGDAITIDGEPVFT